MRAFLSLGDQPLGNAFIPASAIASEREFPLTMGVCSRCHLVQIVAPAPVEAIEQVYRNYSYVPTGATLAQHYGALAGDIVRIVEPKAEAQFLDIGSNDGLLLRSIRERVPAARIGGVEPSPRIAEIARSLGVPTINGFFDSAAADEVMSRFGRIDVASATQVLQHIRDPEAFLRSVARILNPDGVLVLEGRAYFPDVAEKISFDTFYHELLYCFTLHSLEQLLGLAGFTVFHAERSDVYGGSLRVFAQLRNGGTRAVQASVGNILTAEIAAGIPGFEVYATFALRVAAVRTRLSTTVSELLSTGATIAGYGAPSTGTTLLRYCGLGHDVLQYIVDDNPLKQGLVTPGTHVPISPSSALVERPPDFVLVIAWRLREDILSRLAPLRGDRIKGVIFPLPTPELVR
ncbi:MAG: class I SAM-dependent methyltransferase [Thermoplasmata archaeon]|nr:class I SAM-dependent methyltransferase [Thermoplasmata archaeon]